MGYNNRWNDIVTILSACYINILAAGGGLAQTRIPGLMRDKGLPVRSSNWDGGRKQLQSYRLLHLDAKSWGKTRGDMPRKWRLQRRCKEHFSGERNGARPAPANGARARKGRTRCTMSLRGRGSRGPGGLSTGARTGRNAGMARKIEAFFPAICSCFFSPAPGTARAHRPGRRRTAGWVEAVSLCGGDGELRVRGNLPGWSMAGRS